MEAITEKDSVEVRAWFTSSIAVPAGPGKYGALPGLVLAVDIDNGERIIQAKSIELEPVQKDLIKKPRKGKKVTEEEFQAIVEEKMKEMGAEHEGGSGHSVVVRIHR
jgi:GLPGLI family protein